MSKPVTSITSLGIVDHNLAQTAKTSDARALIEKVRKLVKEYDFATARDITSQIPDLKERALAYELIEKTVHNFSTIEEDFPWG